MISVFFYLFFILNYVHTISAARILGVFPTPSLSHQVVFRALTLELAKGGHELTVITPDPVKDPPENFHQIDVHNVSYDIWKTSFNSAKFGVKKRSVKDFYLEVGQAIMSTFNEQLNNSNVQKIIQGHEEFDLVLIESILSYAYAFARIVKAPFIGISSMPAMTESYAAVGSPNHPVLYPAFFTEKFTDLTLLDKINNVMVHALTNTFLDWHYNDLIEKRMKNWFGNDIPSPPEIEKNVDLLITNNYPVISGIRPLVPAVVIAGGLHMEPRKPLPKDLQYYLDNSIQGVIYFNLGTNVLSKDLPRVLIEVFLDVFSKLPFNILWKFEEDTLLGIPDNVRIMKWLPQFDLLGNIKDHPNIKLFITQGGQQSMEEAIHSAVPLLAIPFFGDQAFNAERIKILNIGLRINPAELTRTELSEKIETITTEPKFKNNAKKLRELIIDEPESGLDRAIWWKEYVIRHEGAKHLRSAAKDATLVEYFLIDVVTICLLITCITVSITIGLAKVIIMRVGYFLHRYSKNQNHRAID